MSGVPHADSLGARVADVVRLPVRTANSGARAVVEWSANQVDDWGRDADFVGRARTLSLLRWRVEVGGHQHLPARGAGLIVVNARRFALTPIYAALAIGDAIDRPVRFVGRPDVAPVGAFMQRLGGLLTNLDDVTNVLRAGELVVLGSAPTTHTRQVGTIDHHVVGAALATGAKVFPAATASAPFRRGARVEIAPAARADRRRRGPLAELELADTVAASIQSLLDELGSTGGYLR